MSADNLAAYQTWSTQWGIATGLVCFEIVLVALFITPWAYGLIRHFKKEK